KGPLNRANRVIGGWLADGDFTDEDNNPRQLSLRDEEFSFETLVDRYSGGTTYRAILDELVRVGTVSLLDKKIVKLMRHGYIPSKNTAEMTDVVSTHVADLLSTVVHNLNQPNETRFQRQVTYANVPISVAKEFQQLSHDKSLALILELNQWLASRCKGTEPKQDEQTSRVGVGIYYFNNEKDEE
ncbi:MAG: DUF6502 family protein, partial [Thiohalomonadales bacterium]